MTYVVTENCIKCKYTDCVSVCPVHCFHEGANMLVIDPEACLDCDECRPACPAKAIKSDSDPALEQWPKINADFAKRWPKITAKKNPPADAKQWDGIPSKFEKYFDTKPAG